MKARDKAILSDLKRFRVMTREDIEELHFQGLKHPTANCNAVLLRLKRDGQIRAITDRRMYCYVHSDVQLRPDSTKIPHFLAIVSFYRELCEIEKPTLFEVEPKLGSKGTVEVDCQVIWRKSPFFVEIQRNLYSGKVFTAKMSRYEQYFHSKEWKQLTWQPKNNPVFPHVWIITENKYTLSKRLPFRVIQSKDSKIA
ncbi:hypothetical protein ACI2JA_19745 [Alkalihalobacillus sp. NPDC078783]|uniref:hypothetical protein n=1 Tax=Streptomyces albidoflavus TaxID=1886 RepID=UPI0033D2D955